MSVLMRDLVFRGSANMQEVDTGNQGGAVDFSKKINFVDISPNGTMDYVSSSASDTATTIRLYGRDTTGTIQNTDGTAGLVTLTGTTVVAGTQTYERLMKGVVSGTTPVGNVAAISHTAILATRTAQAAANASGTTDASITLQSGDGASCAIGDIIRILNNTPSGVQFQLKEVIALSGDIAYVDSDWGTVPSSSTTYSVFQGFFFNLLPNRVSEIRRPFYNAASDVSGGSTRNYYEKIFAVNNNTATALTVASVVKQVDPGSGTINFALTYGGSGATLGLNDTGVVGNRTTAPSSNVTAFSSGSAPQTINIPNTNQNLPSGTAPNSAGAQGIWLQLQLTAGLAPAKTSFTMRQAGQTV